MIAGRSKNARSDYQRSHQRLKASRNADDDTNGARLHKQAVALTDGDFPMLDPKRRDTDRDLLGPFLHYLMAECGVSPNTLAAYRADLARFSRWRKRYAPVPLAKLDVKDLLQYIDYLVELGLAPSSVGRHIASLSTYFRFLIYDGRLTENVAKLLSAPTLWDRLPTVLGPAAVDRLLSAPSAETSLGRRDRAALEILYATGCRASEVVGLRPFDLDLTAGTARCVGKGDKQRIVPLGSRARAAIELYLARDRPRFVARRPETAELLVSRLGRPISRVGLWRVVTKHAGAAGLSGKVSPHTLRHSFATHMLAGGADLRVVQELLGHASIGTTQIYTRVEMSRLLEIHKKYHPRGA
jgi:integrase/recombinase XerD